MICRLLWASRSINPLLMRVPEKRWERGMALKTMAVAKKGTGEAAGGAVRRRRSIEDDVKASREKAQAARFPSLVNGFEARVREIDAALTSAIKSLAG